MKTSVVSLGSSQFRPGPAGTNPSRRTRGAAGAIAFLAILLAGGPTFAAEQKIATVEMNRIFENYYKTKLANVTLRDEASGLLKSRKDLVEDYQKAGDDYKKALEEANNQALSADEREKRKKETEGKLLKVNDLRQQLEQFEKSATSQLEERQRIATEKIVAEIRAVISNQAKARGITLVLDSGVVGPSKTGVVLYNSGDHDLTDSVLKEINANAPADLPSDDKKPEEKK